MLSLHAPLFLVLLLPLAGLALAAGLQLAGRAATRRRRLGVLALRCGSLAVLIVALSQPFLPASGHAVPVVFVADTSASISPSMRAEEIAWLQQAPRHTTADLVTYAGSQALSPLPSTSTNGLRSRLAPGADAGQSDMASALRLALGDAPDGARIVLLSDGLQTTGDARALTATAAARQIAIDTVALASTPAPDAALTRLDVPPQVHTGDAVPLQITISSNRAENATLSVSQDGQLIGQQPLTLRVGENPFLVTLRAPAPGWHSYHVGVAMPGDSVRQNDALDATTQVIGTPRLLLVTGDPGSAVPALLSKLGFALTIAPPVGMPSRLQALAQYDAVVLDDVPLPALRSAQVAALDQAVHNQGIGLFVLGGQHSLTLGHYSQSALEKLLPVLSQPPTSLQQGAIALQLVLDRSGSMNDLAGDVPKIDMSRSAANIAVDFAVQHQDDLGVVSFDIATHTLFPMQTVTKSAAARAHTIIGGMTADGGTDIYDALRVGLTQIQRSNAPYKHIILMTDGRSDPANYEPLLRLAQRLQVTISTVGLGQDADVNLLRYMAAKGKGRFYYTNNAADLPRIFAEESRLSAGSARVTGTIDVTIDASSPVVRSLGGTSVPALHGYVATVLKPEATGDLLTHAGTRHPDPVLAQWQYGLGRVLVWTPGASPGWAGAWLNGEQTLWDDATRWILRGATAATLTPRLIPGAGPSMVRIDTEANSGAPIDLAYLNGLVRTPTGTHATISITQVGPGRYQATLPAAGPGVYQVTVQQLGVVRTQTTALLAVPYSAEYVPHAPDRALMAELAGATGGRVLDAVRPYHAWDGLNGGGSATEVWWPLAAIALALFMVDVALRTTGWGKRTGEPVSGS